MTKQPDASAPRPAQPPAARTQDVASIDAILAALYEVISGPAGAARDWARFRALFLSGARLIPTAREAEGRLSAHVLDVDGFINRVTEIFATQSFYERAVANRVEQFGQIAQVFSTYEARRDPADTEPFVRGINSIQLMHDGRRWWVVTIFWQAEDAAAPLPEKYL
jgi:hypothetical protein